MMEKNNVDKHSVVAHRASVDAEDGHQILVDSWHPEAETSPKALLHIFHGLGEHSARYERFAQSCAASGIIIVAHNHRGHGENCDADSLGHYADKDGWNKLIADALLVQNDARVNYPDLPLVLMGHSMGSYIAQSFVMRHPQNVSQLILSASTYAPRLRLRLGKLLATFDAWRHGPRHRSDMLNQMSFGNFNKHFAPNRTEFDWLSRDEHEVDKYVDDPLCGAPSSSQLWHDLTGGLLEITAKRAVTSVPHAMPMLILGGQFDPVGGEKGLTLLADAYRRTGHEDVTLQIYPDGRHEMLNETNRDEVTTDIIRWIEDHL